MGMTITVPVVTDNVTLTNKETWIEAKIPQGCTVAPLASLFLPKPETWRDHPPML